MDTPPQPWFRLWLAAVALFLLAGTTGAVYRFSVLYGPPWGLALGNVRHAHTHLMFLGWATPALFSLIAQWWPRVTGRPWTRPRWLAAVIWLTLLCALATYVPFLLFGYGMAAIGTVKLPLASMLLGVAMLSWYAFIALYVWESWGAPRPLPVQLWDAALGFMVLASVGAWGVAIVARLGLPNPFWAEAATHLFLDTFTDGWFLLAVLGLLFAVLPATQTAAHTSWFLGAVVAGVPLLFLLNVTVAALPRGARGLAAVGGASAVVGLVGLGQALWRVAPPLGRWPLGFLALKTTAVALLLWPRSALWLGQMGLRISIMHWLLLGFVTLSMVWVAQQSWPRLAAVPFAWLVVAVTVLLLSLIPLTGLSPWIFGRGALLMAAWGTLGPLAIMAGMWVAGWATPAPEG